MLLGRQIGSLSLPVPSLFLVMGMRRVVSLIAALSDSGEGVVSLPSQTSNPFFISQRLFLLPWVPNQKTGVMLDPSSSAPILNPIHWPPKFSQYPGPEFLNFSLGPRCHPPVLSESQILLWLPDDFRMKPRQYLKVFCCWSLPFPPDLPGTICHPRDHLGRHVGPLSCPSAYQHALFFRLLAVWSYISTQKALCFGNVYSSL